MRMTHPRIQPLEKDQWNEEAAALLTPIAERGRVLNIFKTLANHSALARRWMVFANHILGKSTLPEKERELVILRIGYLCQAGYEWGQHVEIARRAGMTDEEILCSKRGPQTPGLSPLYRLLFEATDELRLYSANVAPASLRSATPPQPRAGRGAARGAADGHALCLRNRFV